MKRVKKVEYNTLDGLFNNSVQLTLNNIRFGRVNHKIYGWVNLEISESLRHILQELLDEFIPGAKIENATQIDTSYIVLRCYNDKYLFVLQNNDVTDYDTVKRILTK